jgi:hypothetical protein
MQDINLNNDSSKHSAREPIPPRIYTSHTHNNPERNAQVARASDSPAYIEPARPRQTSTRGSFPCHWGYCNTVFTNELQVHDHLIAAHFARHEPRSKHPITGCMWRPGTTTNSTSCGYVYKTNTSFRDHIISHFSSKLKPLGCELCGQRFRNRQR